LFETSLERPPTTRAIAAALRIAGGETQDGGTTRRTEGGAQRRSLTVLVAEDNRTNQKVIAKILERAGHRSQIAENGEIALDALERQEFDLVLMDINMPVMNGLEATKLHRFASLGSRRVPIVALTADASPEIQARCEEAGMDACLTKPIEPARLLQVIESLVAADAGTTFVQPGEEPEAAAPAAIEADAPAVDGRTIDALAELGGADFVAELASQFVGDAATVLRELADAAKDADVQSFREQAHALRSAAANIGAKRIFEMCLAWREMQPDDLARCGEDYLARLKVEFDEVRAALRAHLPEAARDGTAPPALTVIEGGRALAG
jgi:two-component system, sensor histidine kinase RpfC